MSGFVNIWFVYDSSGKFVGFVSGTDYSQAEQAAQYKYGKNCTLVCEFGDLC